MTPARTRAYALDHVNQGDRMANFVLVHGAWRGGWIWKRVRPLLARAGHEVFNQ